MICDQSIPRWLEPYASGEKMGWSQNYMAYAAYYDVDGSADDDPEYEERIVMQRPSIVGYSLRWKERLRGMPTKLLFAVQNGMQIDDVASLLSPAVGIFIGGTTEWKEATAQAWGSLARRRNCHLHVGRVNSARRIRICAAAGANSFDGSGVSRYAEALPRLDRATRQADLFAAASESLEEAQLATTDLNL